MAGHFSTRNPKALKFSGKPGRTTLVDTRKPARMWAFSSLIFLSAFLALQGAFSHQYWANAEGTRTKILFVTRRTAIERELSLNVNASAQLHYNKFWLDITRDKPFVDANGTKVVVPDTSTFKGIQEITIRFWHPRGEPALLGAIIVKAYDKYGKPVKHGAFDRGVIVVLLSGSLFKGHYVRFDGIGHYIEGDQALYVKVLVRDTRQIALIPFANFMNDFTRQINTQPVVSWAVKRP